MTIRTRDPFSFYSEPFDGEPAHGYVLRRIGEEFHRSTSVYLDLVMDDRIGSFQARSSRLVNEMKMPADARSKLERWTPRKVKQHVLINGERLKPSQVVLESRRCCPGCIYENPFHRVWWDISCFSNCPIHSTPIVDRNSMGKRYVWSWPNLAVDRFGYEYGSPTPRNPAPASFEHYLLQRLGAADVTLARPLLDAIHFDHVIEHCFLLGRLLSNPYSMRTPKRRPEDYEVGYRALAGTKEELHRSIEEWVLENTTQSQRNNGADFAYGWVRRGSRTTHLKKMRLLEASMQVVLARNGRIGRSGLKGQKDLVHREITLSELAERLKVRKKSLSSLVRSIGIPMVEKGRFYYFDPKHVSEIERAVTGLVSKEKAAAMLGCSERIVRGLVENGRLRSHKGLLSGLGNGFVVSVADIEALLKIIAEVPVLGESHSVFSLSTFHQRERVPPHEIVERVLNGTLQVAARDPTRQGICAWRFHIADLAKPARRRPRWKQPPSTCMTKAEAAALTSFHPRTVSHLEKVGAFCKSSVDEQWLDRKSVEAFHRLYVKAWHYRKELALSPTDPTGSLDKLGIRLRFRSDSTVSDMVIRRADLTRVLGVEGVKAPSKAARDIWKRFKSAYQEGYCAFHMPAEIGVKIQRISLASRRTFFEVYAEADAVVVRKTFTTSRPREWRVFEASKHLFHDSLAGFDWDHGKDAHVAEIRMRSIEDIRIVRTAIDALHWHVRKLIFRE